MSCWISNNSISQSFLNQSFSAHLTSWKFCGLNSETNYSCFIIPFDSYGRNGRQSEIINFTTKQSAPIEAPIFKNCNIIKMVFIYFKKILI